MGLTMIVLGLAAMAAGHRLTRPHSAPPAPVPPCPHLNATPVTDLLGQHVADLCLDCDEQLEVAHAR